jgi:hypothetical protein
MLTMVWCRLLVKPNDLEFLAGLFRIDVWDRPLWLSLVGRIEAA